MKIATDIKQSKILADILLINSADMYWNNASIRGVDYVDVFHLETEPYKGVVDTSWVKSYKSINPMFEVVPAWSLSALLLLLPQDYSIGNKKGKFYVCMTHIKHDVKFFEEPIDACVAMIEKLHELRML